MTAILHVFALNMPVTVRHTNLTRQQGLEPELPPLAAWLGADALNTESVELFPIADLTDLTLPDYLEAAYDIDEEDLRKAAARLRALGGSVLLVPDRAISPGFTPGPEATEIARLEMPRADHTGVLPKAVIPKPTAKAPETAPAPDKPKAKWTAPIIGLALVLAAALVWSLR